MNGLDSRLPPLSLFSARAHHTPSPPQRGSRPGGCGGASSAIHAAVFAAEPLAFWGRTTLLTDAARKALVAAAAAPVSRWRVHKQI